MTERSAAVLVALAALAAPAWALEPQITTAYGIDFVTIGDPGNRDTTVAETVTQAESLHTPRGSVGYAYRMGRTEITMGQWREFVEAYLPYFEPETTGDLSFSGFTSRGIEIDPSTQQIIQRIPDDRPAEVGWTYAARFANWLHNDKATEPWAFETGAYDTSTYQEGPDGSPPTDPQFTASPGARFRLPTPDEWIKAVYWDPNKNGPGEGGYWP